jgi:putative sterol carrier protein
MSKLLSEAWITALHEALASNDETRAELRDVELVLQQHVTGTPDGDVSFWTSIDQGVVTGGMGRAAEADVTLAMDYETAIELSSAELNHQAAFMQGRLKVTGNMGKLLQHQAALQVLGPAMATLATEP